MTPYMNVSCLGYDARRMVCVGWQRKKRPNAGGIVSKHMGYYDTLYECIVSGL